MKKFTLKRHHILAIVFASCLLAANGIVFSETVSAKGIRNMANAKKVAKTQVKGSKIMEASTDYVNGGKIYEIYLEKGTKEYDVVLRASDSKLIAYSSGTQDRYIKGNGKKIVSQAQIEKLAKKKIKGGKIIDVDQTENTNGIDVYDVTMKKGSKEYELEYHAQTKQLLDYGWEISSAFSSFGGSQDDTDGQDNTGGYISAEKAKEIALARTGGGKVKEIGIDIEYGGVAVYELEIRNGSFEYDVEIDAKTGEIIEFESEYEEPDSSDDDSISDDGSTYIGTEKAKEIAIERAGGGRVKKIKLEMEDGVAVYEVEVINGRYEHEMEINAATGGIIKYEVEEDD